MLRVSDTLKDNRERGAKCISTEMGKPLAESRTEIERCVQVCRYFAEQAEVLLKSEERQASDGVASVSFEPIGPVLAIMPWNFPFWQLFRCAAPALMSGNPIILKHAPCVPRSAILIAEIFQTSGAPEGLFQNLFLSDEQAAQLIADVRVRGVSLTGSVRAGKAIAEQAGNFLKPCVLELGGSDPLIVFADADQKAALENAVKMRAANNGQSCISPKRIFVEQSVASSFINDFVQAFKSKRLGDPLEPSTDIGPMARDDLRQGLDAQVKKSISQGAKCLLGGEQRKGEGFFYLPTVLTDVNRENCASNEELFGPVAVIMPFSSEDELIERANDSSFGLGASIWTSNAERAQRVARRLEVGNIYLNSFVRSDPMLPFGGCKDSGLGRELGLEGLKSFTNVKTVWRSK